MAEDNQESSNAEKNSEQSKEASIDNDADEEPDFDDPEGYVDDIPEEELLEHLLKTKPKETDGVEAVVVVDGIPMVGPERLEKLKNVIKKIFSQFGVVLTEYYPVDESGKTKGYAFMEFTSGDFAREAVKSTNGYRLDKQHVFSVNLFSDFDKYEKISKDWEEPEVQPYIDHGNLRSWLLEPNCYDQYSIIYEAGGKTAVYYNSQPEPTLVKERERWTETCVSWSPLGTYLSTFHQRGIALWGGEDFKQIMKFSHVGVQFIDFSPCEKYVVTFSSLPETRDDPQSIIIWDIRTGSKKRTFSSDSHQTIWPVFKWSFDDKFFARMGTDVISIYETPSFGLLDKKSIKAPGIRNFSWSPNQNIMGYWVAEDKDTPARVTLLEIPSRTELRTKNLFNVADCKMHWQKAGEFLCMKVDRYTKAKKEKDNDWKYSGLYYNFEIFHMREKQIPVDSIEFKENIMAFSWEPVGGKFAIIHGDAPHISVSFYGIKTGGTVVFQKKFERKQCNHLFWSPNGQFIVLAGLRSMSGALEFVDTSDYTVMAQTEHYMAMDVEWDPTGRYVITAVSYWGGKVDYAYWIWSFQGKLVSKRNLDRFCQLLWRPRPPTLLSEAKIKEIKKSLSTKYSTQFDNTDKLSQSKASRELIDKRRKLMDDFKTYRKKKEDEYALQKKIRLELRNNVDTDEVDSHTENLEEEKIEFFVKEEVTLIEEEE